MTRQPLRTSRSSARGFTLIELLITVGIIGIIMIVTVPSLLRAKMSGNEVSAIASLRTINTAESAYAGSASEGKYATQLSVLTQPCPGGSQGFLSVEFAGDPSQKSGYSVVLDAGTSAAGPPDCNGVVTREGYYLTGEPITSGRTGLRSFATSESGVIYFNASGAPPTEAQISGGGATPIQ
jgi:prepilin-type N-terminal cleavage/methylation domain-containing protein